MRGDCIVACSAAEIADKIAVIEGLEKEQKTAAAQRCARIYVECSPKPGTVYMSDQVWKFKQKPQMFCY